MTSWIPDLSGRNGPRYRAIAETLAEDVRGGRLAGGTQLPTQRDLAWKLHVTVGTVSRAYAEAERRGLIAGEVGGGPMYGIRLGWRRWCPATFSARHRIPISSI